MRYSIRRQGKNYRLMYKMAESDQWESVFDDAMPGDRLREVIARGIKRGEIDERVADLVEFRIRRKNSERNGQTAR